MFENMRVFVLSPFTDQYSQAIADAKNDFPDPGSPLIPIIWFLMIPMGSSV